jgi:hypothetical protein
VLTAEGDAEPDAAVEPHAVSAIAIAHTKI